MAAERAEELSAKLKRAEKERDELAAAKAASMCLETAHAMRRRRPRTDESTTPIAALTTGTEIKQSMHIQFSSPSD